VPNRGYNVQLEDRCDIVERGEALQVWFVERNDGWMRACEHPAKLEEAMQAEPARVPPGTVWVRRTDLELPRGTALWRVKTWPLPTTDTGPERILQRDVRGVKRVRQDVYYRVAGTYAVVADKERNSRRLWTRQYRPRSERTAMHEQELVALDQRRREQLARLAEAFGEIGADRSGTAATFRRQGTPPARPGDLKRDCGEEARQQREALLVWAGGEGLKKASSDR
jgi:hypothetical protein